MECSFKFLDLCMFLYTYLHLFKDCSTVISDNDFSIWTDKHLVHSFWSQWCLQEACNCSSGKNVNLLSVNKCVNSNWYSFMFEGQICNNTNSLSYQYFIENVCNSHFEMIADYLINGWCDTYLMSLSTLDSLLFALLPEDNERPARLVES